MASRIPVIAGNWKMNTNVDSAVELAQGIFELSNDITGVDKIVCPPFISISSVAAALDGTTIQVGAQNVSASPDGAFTGEISTSMLNGMVDYAIVGHSERRALHGETSGQVAEKAIAAAASGIAPILCVGEDLSVRQSGEAARFVSAQLEESLDGFNDWASLIIAYEPVWAIGTGEAATSEQAQEMTALCREVVRKLSPDTAESVRVLYGGSVNSDNVSDFLTQPDVDGALVGGASLKADEFSKLIAAAGNG
jgi:triosephosphate isomerase